MKFNNILITFFTLSIITILGLSIIQSNKPKAVLSPYIYVHEVVDQNQDRIFRSNDGGNNTENIITGSKIQAFGQNNKYILYSKGEKNKKTQLELYNNETKNSNTIFIEGDQYISKIIPIPNKFIFLYEAVSTEFRSYQARIGIYDFINNKFESPNPQLLAKDVSELYANNEGTLAVFTGFNNYKYVMDLNNYENIKRIPTNFNYTSGFINENILVAGKYNSEEVMFINLLDNSTTTSKIEYKFYESYISTDNKNLFYSVREDPEKNIFYRLSDTNAMINLYDTEVSYITPNLSYDQQFLLFKKVTKENQEKEKDYKISGSINNQIGILDIKKNYTVITPMKGVGYQFEFK